MSLLGKLIVNLRILSKIEENGKLSTTSPGQVILEGSSLMTPLWRSVMGDSRDKTVSFLVQLINDATEISDSMINSPYMLEFDVNNIYQMTERKKKIEELINLSRQLQNSKKGMVNLHATYKGDATASSRIEEIMEQVDRLVNTIESSLAILKNKERSVEQLKTTTRY